MFSTLPTNHAVTLHTKDLDVCKDQLTEIYQGSWDEIVDHTTELVVKSNSMENSADPNPTSKFLF